jgi:hypothetical protein
MTTKAMVLNPGTPLSSAAKAGLNARRGIRMRWTALGAVPQGRKHGLSRTVVETVELGAIERKAAAAAYVCGAVDFPSDIQFRVPLYLRERSP